MSLSKRKIENIWMLVGALVFLLGICSCSPTYAKPAPSPYEVCERVTDNWDYRTDSYTAETIESATQHNTEYTCIVRVIRHKVEASYPTHVIIKFDAIGKGYSVHRWGH